MNLKKIVESLSQNERKIIPYLDNSLKDICKKTTLDKVSVLRALEFLQNKGVVKLKTNKIQWISLGINGILYRKKGLPERRLLNKLAERIILPLENAKRISGLTDDEFKAAIGALKRKAMIEIKNGKIFLSAKKEEIAKKTLEEKFLESLPRKYEDLQPEEMYALKSLQERRGIIEIKNKTEVNITITELGKKLMKTELKNEEYIEAIDEKLIKSGKWKGKKFRRYDVTSPVPEIYGGKRHFVNQAIDYGRKIRTEMGFKEMTGNMTVSSFWNFDALFTAQDHPVREMHDTFFLKDVKAELPDKKLVEAVKKAHEGGIAGSRGWGYEWNEEEAKKMLIRTHTTCLSSQTLAKLKEKDLPAKFFAIGTNFRNETVDWNHGFELLQTEGIVVDPNANFRHLLGYLKQFAEKMGFKKIRFRPAYFPYTEPSLEGDVWNEEKQEWVELIAAGIFRPEVTEPLLGKPIPVLAWGPGFGRMIMSLFKIKDIRELNKNDLTQLRKMKFLIK